MKKTNLLMIAGALAFATTANAQKGGVLVGGSFGITINNETDKEKDEDGDEYEQAEKTTTINFSPAIGYNISDKFMVGLWFDVNSSKTTYEETGEVDLESKSGGFGIGPFFRFTKSMGDVFSLYGQANIGFKGGSSEYETQVGYDPLTGDPIYGTVKSNSGGFIFDLFPAIGVNCGSGWALNFSFGGLGFSSMISEPKDNPDDQSTTNSNVNFGFNPQLNIGVSKTFGGKKD